MLSGSFQFLLSFWLFFYCG